MKRAWLLMAAGDDRQHGGNDGYDDQPDAYYSWDSTVSNHAAVAVGDPVVLWDKQTALGMSVVESIDRQEGVPKRRYRCPSCGRSGLKVRTTFPEDLRYRCHNCEAQFGEPETYVSSVTVYRSRHDAAWVPLVGLIDGPTLRGLAESPDSQLSIRALDWSAFSSVLRSLGREGPLDLVDRRASLTGGHRQAVTRVRVGQGAFRRRLFEHFGPVCALTGEAPPQVLEAGHLYSYAKLGEHEDHGGLLFRRDVHRLFDAGILAVDPSTETVDVDATVVHYPPYGALQGEPVRVHLTERHKVWLARHWRQFRGGP